MKFRAHVVLFWDFSRCLHDRAGDHCETKPDSLIISQ